MTNESDTRKVVILADGAFPHHVTPLARLRAADIIVCCDHAYLKWKAYTKDNTVQAKTVYVVGDGDSLSHTIREELGENFIHIAEQESNDLTKSVRFCFANGWYAPVLLGTTGLREDHTLGNISLLWDYQQQLSQLFATKQEAMPTLQLVTDYGIFTVAWGEKKYRSFAGQQISFFSMVPDKRITVTNMQYPVEQRCFTNWWQGTLNTALSNHFALAVEPGGAALVYQMFLPKEEELHSK